MKNLLLGSLLLLTACVTLPQRYAFAPKTSDGVQCKGACSQVYSSCVRDAKDSCLSFSDKPCGEKALAIESEMVSCIDEESSYMRVCEGSEHSG